MNPLQDILETLEKIDDDFDQKEVEVVKCSDPDFAREEFGLGGQLPFLAIFENEVLREILKISPPLCIKISYVV